MNRTLAYLHILLLGSTLIIACGDDGSASDGGMDVSLDRMAICGDDDLFGDEVCDDGNLVSGDGCSADCMSLERCGNGYIDEAIGETCDDANTVNGDGCSADCTSDETCGNGIVDLGVGEVCDDGNNEDMDGCSADCSMGPMCGDGMMNGGEACDDGNMESGDGCSADCTSDETCGNGTVDTGEECDDDNTDPDDGCSATCTIERCGNNAVEGTEECDDGNMVDGDGCEGDCTFECTADTDCDDGMPCNGAETCDSNACAAGAPPANGTDCGGGNVCRGGACLAPVCGNSMTEGTEDCDDGNSVGGDGCENDCTYSCTADGDCDDGEACNGAETCNTGNNTCRNPADLSDGASCGGGNVCNGGVCTSASCGDTIVVAPEQCDDGNTTNGDGCDNDCTFSCENAGDCDDGDDCNGVETCNTGSNTCSPGSAAADGNVCDRDMMAGTRDICLSAICVATNCGDSYVDDAMGGTEQCDDGNMTDGDGCDNDCSFSCVADADCDDGNACNGAETCNTGSNTCQNGSNASDGTACDRDMMPGTRDICLSASCVATSCGDNYQDTMATPPEECDDGNLTAGDGCEPDCTVTGTRPSVFRVTSMDLVNPHLYHRAFFCLDITDSIPFGDSVNEQLQASLDDYTLNYMTVHQPLDITPGTTPVYLVDGECMASTPNDTCQLGMGTAYPYTATNTAAGGTCFTPDASRYFHAAPNTASGPCFVTDQQDLSVNVGGLDIPLKDAQVTGTYSGGTPPTRLISGVITGFLTESDARTTVIPVTVGTIGGDTLYEHLADGGAMGSSCSSADESVMYAPSSGGGSVNGFWFFLNFQADEATWSGPALP